MSKSKLLNIRIDPDLKKRAKKLAQADGRSLSNWVTLLIVREVEENDGDAGKRKGKEKEKEKDREREKEKA